MKILVIDDSQRHLAAAKQLFTTDELTVCDNHDEGLDLLSPMYDKERKEALQAEYKASGMDWGAARDKACAETLLPYWDVVLCDLLMPAGRKTQGDEGLRFAGQEMPVGWSLALVAAKYGARYVAVVTDMNHHHHPASAMLDPLANTVFSVGESRMLLTNDAGDVTIEGSEHKCTHCTDGKSRWRDQVSDCHYCNGTQIVSDYGKNWQRVLDYLITGKVTRG